MRSERGQGTVEWVGIVCLVSLVFLGLLAVGVRIPGVDLARSIGQRILCATELADGCGDEPRLIATYGDEIGRLVRQPCRRSASSRAPALSRSTTAAAARPDAATRPKTASSTAPTNGCR